MPIADSRVHLVQCTTIWSALPTEYDNANALLTLKESLLILKLVE
ncbi:MAG: hypothetical protein ABW185_00455 [Sedimenticola sp.]